jgi:hypothetical protein
MAFKEAITSNSMIGSGYMNIHWKAGSKENNIEILEFGEV